MRFNNTNKYYNIKKEYKGRVYHSKKEADYACELDLLQRANEIKWWIPQYKVDLSVNDSKICSYKLDFKVCHKDNSIELIEVKGYETDAWKLKWKLLNAIYQKEYPKIKLTIVK